MSWPIGESMEQERSYPASLLCLKPEVCGHMLCGEQCLNQAAIDCQTRGGGA